MNEHAVNPHPVAHPDSNETESASYKLLVKTVDPKRLQKELISELDAIKAKVKDSQPITYADFETIIDLSRLLNHVVKSREVIEVAAPTPVPSANAAE